MSQPKIKQPSQASKAITKYAYSLVRRDGGYSVVTYSIDGNDKATEVSSTEPNMLEIAINHMRQVAIRTYHQMSK
jgi:hypothetical protein